MTTVVFDDWRMPMYDVHVRTAISAIETSHQGISKPVSARTKSERTWPNSIDNAAGTSGSNKNHSQLVVKPTKWPSATEWMTK